MFLAVAPFKPATWRRRLGEAVLTSTPTALTQSSTTGFQGLCQPFLGHIVLILAHANGLGLNFHQLRQRILKPPGDGDGRAEIHIVFRKFLCRQGGGGSTPRPQPR